MCELAAEGFMHNRARMITASFLTRNLGIDRWHGYAHFDFLLATQTWRTTRVTGSGWPGAVVPPGPTG